jgi:hypothetical protein
MAKMKSILVNGQDCPVIESLNGLPLIVLKGHRGVVVNNENEATGLMSMGTTFLCPIGFIRPSIGDENIRKDLPSESEIAKTREMIRVRGDIGTIKVVRDKTGKKLFRILDGSTKYPIYLEEYPMITHVFVEYVELVDDELSIINEQVVANTHIPMSEKAKAFYTLRGKNLAKGLPNLDERDKQLAILIADSGGKVQFAKRCNRASNAIAELWDALASKAISIESLDWIATLVNPETAEILVDLQKEVLASAIANKLSTSHVQSKVSAALANWEAEEERKKTLATPTPVIEPVEVLPDADGTFEIPKAKGIQRPTGVTKKGTVPSTPNPKTVAPAPEPKAKVTAAQAKHQQQTLKSVKGKGGTKKPAATAAKAFTNAPSATMAIAPDVEEAIVKIDPYQTFLDIETALVKAKLVNSNGSGVPKSSLTQMESMSLKQVDDSLVQIGIIDMMLTQVKSILSAVQMDLKDKQ